MMLETLCNQNTLEMLFKDLIIITCHTLCSYFGGFPLDGSACTSVSLCEFIIFLLIPSYKFLINQLLSESVVSYIKTYLLILFYYIPNSFVTKYCLICPLN